MIPLKLPSSYVFLYHFLLDSNMPGFCSLLSETRNNTLFHVYEEPSLKVMPSDVNWK